MKISPKLILVGILILSIVLTGCSKKETTENPNINLAAIKEYAKENNTKMQTNTQNLATLATEYYTIIETANFDYSKAYQENQASIDEILNKAKKAWLDASYYYELNEGIIAGVASLADFDVWIDAGPSKSEDPIEAREWSLELINGEVLDSPGNFFHSLLEPTLWGTNPEFNVNVNGVNLPEAYLLEAATRDLNKATAEMAKAVNEWEPTVEDIFTALLTMIPTMSEYFEQWKTSYFVAGNNSEEKAFVAVSRLLDVKGILNGLNVSYQNVSELITDQELKSQINTDFEILIKYVDDLYAQEQQGKVFTAQEADTFGVQAQEYATNLAGLVSVAAEGLQLELE